MSGKTDDPANPLKRLLSMGVAAYRDGSFSTAEKIFRQVLRQHPKHPRGLHLLGTALDAQGRHPEAIEAFTKALPAQRNNPRFFNNLGNAFRAGGEVIRAKQAYTRALKLNPTYSKAHCNLARLLNDEDQPQEALQHYRRATESEVQMAEAWLGLARMQRQFEQLQAAEGSYARALELAPEDVPTLVELASLYQSRLQTQRGIPLLEKAMALESENPLPIFNLGQALGELGEVDRSEACHRRVLELAPRTMQSVLAVAKAERDRTEWSTWEDTGRFLSNLDPDQIASAPAPFLLNLYPTSAETHLRVARSYSNAFESRAKRLGGPIRRPREGHSSRLRLGFVSADFRQHPVGYLTHRLFAHLDRGHFEVFAYSLLPVDDPVTLVVREGVDVYRECARLTDLDVARRIASDGVDILVDLTGYTTYSRPTILALRPAPTAIQHAGYVNTLGADFVPWQLIDRQIAGPEQRIGFHERLLFMPNCVFPVSPLQGLIDPAGQHWTRSGVGLPDRVPVIASFNAPYKLDPLTFDAWAVVLHEVGDAVLWLYDGGQPKCPENLRREATKRGLDPNRLFFASKVPYPRHLNRYRLADLFVDSFVYNGGATTIDSLRSGLPVVTLPGRGPLSRMGSSIVRSAGLPDLVATDVDDYVEKAIGILKTEDSRREWRDRTTEASAGAPLFDLEGWVRDYESGLQLIWEHTKNGTEGDIVLSDSARKELENQ
ncbi:MAG: tetratricopeptide repeat protein [Thermoanaerobaculia bacterium]|nr:tetratricopeptide repeat protein [Thermoanaerobaculia bacterium]